MGAVDELTNCRVSQIVKTSRDSTSGIFGLENESASLCSNVTANLFMKDDITTVKFESVAVVKFGFY